MRAVVQEVPEHWLEERARKGEGERAEAARKAAEAKASTAGRAPPKPGEKPPVDAVAKALKGMKSEPAAVLLARLERPLAVEVLRRMRPADAGALLEKMKPEAAAELLSALADDQRGVSR